MREGPEGLRARGLEWLVQFSRSGVDTMAEQSNDTFRVNRDESRFEIFLEDGMATLGFRQAEEGVLDFESTLVPDEHRGEGIGGELVRRSLEWARDNDYEVIPSCPFVETYVEEHEEFRDLVTSG